MEQSLIDLEPLSGPSDGVRHSRLLSMVGPLPKPIPVSKWNLKFSGDRKSMSVNAFLERVEEVKVARNVSREELFNSGVDIFTDQVLLGIYLAIMSAMFGRLTCPVSEATQLILLHNLSPFYQNQTVLMEVTLIPHLRTLCRKLEERREAVEAFVPPSRRHALELDLAIRNRLGAGIFFDGKNLILDLFVVVNSDIEP